MPNLKELLDKLHKFYWSPEHPSHYTINNPGNNLPCGIGCIARRDYAAFNLAWAASNGKWKTMEDQRRLCKDFTIFEESTSKVVAGFPLSEWVYLYTPAEFHKWVTEAQDITPAQRVGLLPVAEAANRLANSNGVKP